jgi:NAD(P)-dependent dehydrogenase (short-subunit alcohol dehydrogenase family)
MRVVVTGANRGLGLGLTRRFAARGDEVWATARRPAEATELQALARAAGPGRVHVVELDVRNEEQTRALTARVGGDSPEAGLDLLINNAGVSGNWGGGPHNVDAREVLACFETNALGALLVTRALLPKLRAAGGAKIVNMTSLMGSIGDNRSGRAYAYRMSKAALNMATRSLANDLRPLGITVIALHPGWVKTEMGGDGAPEEIDDAVARMVALIDGLGPADSGKFRHAEGKELPW